MTRRAVVAFFAFVMVALLARAAHAAWVEAHLQGIDARLVVAGGGAEQGASSFELTLTYRVVAGALHEVEVQGLRADTLDPVVEVRSEDGAIESASLTTEGDHARITVGGKGLRRGIWVLRVRGAVKLAPREDGALARLAWTTPLAPDGLDGARVVFDLPTAATEPRAEDGAVLVNLRRGPARDELEIVRPHVARGEAASWVARVDPKALGLRAAAPTARAPLLPATERQPARAGIAALIVALLVASLTRAKARASSARALVPLAPLVAGASSGAAAWLELEGQLVIGALVAAAAVIACTFRARARQPHPARGVWRPLPEPGASSARIDPFDATRPGGAALALGIVIVLVVSGRVLQRFDELAPLVVAQLGAIVTPLFLTGVTPAPIDLARGALLNARAELGDLTTGFWARVPREGSAPLELRLEIAPRAPIPGSRGIEIAVGWERSGADHAPELQVLARTIEGSAAHQRLLDADLRPTSREPGRTPDERVFRYVAQGSPAALARAVSDALEERRTATRRHEGPERRRVVRSSAALC